MQKLSPSAQRWLKSFHILSAAVWVGCAITLNVAQFFITPKSDGEFYGIMATLDFIDLFILVPGAMAVLLTGLLFSTLTKWGWFTHTWITVKWLICITGIVVGTIWLGPWISGMAHMAGEQGLTAMTSPVSVSYTHLTLPTN